MAKTFFFDEGPFYPVLVQSSPEGGGGDSKGTAGYTYEAHDEQDNRLHHRGYLELEELDDCLRAVVRFITALVYSLH